MQCQTIKKDKDCFFWAEECTFPGGQCRNLVEKCDGCGRMEEWPSGKYCTSYPAPDKHWSLGMCNMATHINLEEEDTQKMINPLKASKRMGGRR